MINDTVGDHRANKKRTNGVEPPLVRNSPSKRPAIKLPGTNLSSQGGDNVPPLFVAGLWHLIYPSENSLSTSSCCVNFPTSQDARAGYSSLAWRGRSMSPMLAPLQHAKRPPFSIVFSLRESHALSRMTAHVRRFTIDLTPSREDFSLCAVNKYRVQK
jgi:hypothetical protein